MDDYIQINDINTTTPMTMMPGTWSASFDLPVKERKDDSDSDSESDNDESPSCGYANTMGYGTIHKCNPTPPNCPLGRPLVPGRNIEDGLWSLPCSASQKKNGISDIVLVAAIATVAMALILSLRT